MRPSRLVFWAAWLLLFAALRVAAAPAYHVVELGAGAPIAVNSSGTVVGIEGTNASPQPWIVSNGARSALPLPAGAAYAMVNAVSESGVAAGHVSGKPVLWLPVEGGYAAQWIELNGAGPAGQPVGVRDTTAGPQVLLNVGYPGLFASPTWLYFSTSVPYLTSPAAELVNLVGVYGLSSPFTAVDMTAQGRILAGDGRIFNPDGSITAAPPRRTTSWTGWNAVRLNQKGEMVAIASLATSDGHGEIARYSPASGWFVIETWIGAMYPYSADGISEAGDAISTQYGGHMLSTADGQRLPLNGVLIEPGYALTGSGGAMADDGRIVMVGRNPAGTARALRLDPGGAYPPPAPVTLTGVAHPATASAPWTAISLTWTASPGANAYVVERKGPGDASFVALTPASGTIQYKWDDTTVAPLTTYSYRVIARGVGGNGEPSNVVNVLSPPARDSVAPSARITSPASGASVPGTITVSAEASDNVGVVRMEVRDPGGALVASASGDRITAAWDTSRLRRGSRQTIAVRAFDAAGNVGSATLTVRIGR